MQTQQKNSKALLSAKALLALVLVLLLGVSSTYAWTSFSQHALNEAYGAGAKGSFTVHNDIVKSAVTIPQNLLDTDFDYLFELSVPADTTTEGIVVTIDDAETSATEAAQPFLHLSTFSEKSSLERFNADASVQYDSDSSENESWQAVSQNPDGTFTLAGGMSRLRIHMKDGWKATFNEVPIGTEYSIEGYRDYSFGEDPEFKTTSHGTHASAWPHIQGTVENKSEDFIEHRYIRGELLIGKQVKDDSGKEIDKAREYNFLLTIKHVLAKRGQDGKMDTYPGIKVVKNDDGTVKELLFKASDTQDARPLTSSVPFFSGKDGKIIEGRFLSEAAAGAGANTSASSREDNLSDVANQKTDEEGFAAQVTFSFALRDGERLVLPSLPEGVEYAVKEVVPDTFEGEDPYICAEPEGYAGTIKSNKDSIVPKQDICMFENLINPNPSGTTSFAIEKTVVRQSGGELTDQNRSDTFEFVITLPASVFETDEHAPSAGDKVSLNNVDFTMTEDEEKNLIAKGTVKLKHGETVVFDNIPLYTLVKVEEVRKDGYALEDAPSPKLVGEDEALNTFEFTNASVEEYVDVPIKKVWVLQEGSERESQDIEVLVKDVNDSSRIADRITLKANEAHVHNWTHTFTLPKYNEQGAIARYVVEEAPLDGFTTAISKGIATGVTTITNTETKQEDPVPSNPVDPDTPVDPTPDTPVVDDPTPDAPQDPSINQGGANANRADNVNPVIRRVRVLAQTGDPAFWVAFVLFGVAIASILFALVVSRKKRG